MNINFKFNFKEEPSVILPIIRIYINSILLYYILFYLNYITNWTYLLYPIVYCLSYLSYLEIFHVPRFYNFIIFLVLIYLFYIVNSYIFLYYLIMLPFISLSHISNILYYLILCLWNIKYFFCVYTSSSMYSGIICSNTTTINNSTNEFIMIR